MRHIRSVRLARETAARRRRSAATIIAVAIALALTSPAAAQAVPKAYIPFPNGTQLHVEQAWGNDPGGCSSHCSQYDYYAWDFVDKTRTRKATEELKVVSATKGTVVGHRNDFPGSCYPSCSVTGSFGNYVFVHNEDGTYVEYLHMKIGSVVVTDGQPVEVGDPIGQVGDTGNTTGPHLHFGFQKSTSGTGNNPSEGVSIESEFIGISHPFVGENITSNNPGHGTKPPSQLHSAVVLIPGGGGAGYSLDGYGGLHPFGNAPPVVSSSGSWPGWDIARGIAIAPNSTTSAVTGYVLDGWGGLHPFAAGSASPPPQQTDALYWSGWDIARGIVMSTPTSGYVLDGYGGIHPFAAVSTPDPPAVSGNGYWPNWDIARAIVLSTPTSGYQLDGYGGIHEFAGGGAPMPPAPDSRAASWGWDIGRSITLATPTTGYVLDGWGGIHPFAPTGTDLPPTSSPGYSPGTNIFTGVAFDPASGSGVDIKAFMSDGSGGTSYAFNEARTREHTSVVLIPGGGGAGYSFWGGLHPFAAGSASPPPQQTDALYWSGWDIARGIVMSTPTSGYVLDGYGGIHPFAAVSTPDPPAVSGNGYWPNWDIARAIVLSTPTSGYQLDGYGGIHEFAGGGAPMPPAPDSRAASWGWDIGRSITLATPTTGYVLDGWGGIHPFAPTGVSLPPVSGTMPYWPGWDVFDAIAFDPISGVGVDVNIAYVDGSGDTLSTFHGPITSPVATVLAPTGGGPTVTTPSQPSRGVLGTSSHSVQKKKISPLSRALAKCRKIKNHHNRARCIARAKKRYGPGHKHLGGRAKGRR
jgi:Peptidase family M23